MCWRAAVTEADALLFRAAQIGPIAANRTGAWRRGQVVAVFAPVFYLAFDQALLCVANRRAEPGALTLTTDAPEALDWRHIGIAHGQPATVSPGRIEVAGLARIGLSAGRAWSPPAPPPAQLPSVARGLDRLRTNLPHGPAPQGLGRFVDAGYVTDDHFCRAAASPLADARVWASRELHGARIDPVWAKRLIGLGPGLTPAGDDFLGGMMIAFHALGAGDTRDRLWRSIQPRLPHATNQISCALLEAAAQGVGSASLHGALNSLLAGGAGLDAAVSKLAQIGHSSGWDSLAGVVTVLEAKLGAQGLRAA